MADYNKDINVEQLYDTDGNPIQPKIAFDINYAPISQKVIADTNVSDRSYIYGVPRFYAGDGNQLNLKTYDFNKVPQINDQIDAYNKKIGAYQLGVFTDDNGNLYSFIPNGTYATQKYVDDRISNIGELGGFDIDVDNIASLTIFVYRNYDGDIAPERPVGGKWERNNGKIEIYYPDDWSSQEDVVGDSIWMSSSIQLIGGKIIENWTQPIKISGTAGKDGESIEYIYARTKDELTKPPYDGIPNNIDDLKDYINSSGEQIWFDYPNGINETLTAEWILYRTKNSTTDVWGDWLPTEGPVLWSKYGINGKDGSMGEPGSPGKDGLTGIPGVEYITKYCLGRIDTNEEDNEDGAVVYEDNVLNVADISGYIGNDYDSSGWVDSTEELNIYDANIMAEWPYIYCVQGKKLYTRKDESSNEFIESISWGVPFRLSGINGLNGIDGADGTPAPIVYPAGIYNSIIRYVNDGNSAPYVYDSEVAKYFVLNTVDESGWLGSEHNNITPNQSYESDGNKYWQVIENYEAIFAQVGIIANGLIGSAVFNGDYMFSQSGEYNPLATKRYYLYDSNGLYDINNPPLLNSAEWQSEWPITNFTDDYSNIWVKYQIKDPSINTVIDSMEFGPFMKDNISYYSNNYQLFNYNDSENPYSHNNIFYPEYCINLKTGKQWNCNGNVTFDSSIVTFANNTLKINYEKTVEYDDTYQYDAPKDLKGTSSIEFGKYNDITVNSSYKYENDGYTHNSHISVHGSGNTDNGYECLICSTGESATIGCIQTNPSGEKGTIINNDGLFIGDSIYKNYNINTLESSSYEYVSLNYDSINVINNLDSENAIATVITPSKISTSGTIECETLSQLSDESLKTFKGDINIDLDGLSNIPKKYFVWNKDNNKTINIGTSAQEVQKLYPELTSKNSDGNLMLDYAKLSIIALAAIDKLYKKNIELENRIKILEEK